MSIPSGPPPLPKKSRSWFVRLLGRVFSQLLVLVLSYGAFALLLFLLFVLVSSAAQESSVEVPDGSVLVLDLSVNITDAPPQSDFGQIVRSALSGDEMATLYLKQLVDTLDYAATDERISGLFLVGSLYEMDGGSSWAALAEVRAALQRFAAQKPVIGYAVMPSKKDYYLLSTATDLLLHPYGGLFLNGFATERVYLKNAFEKFGIGVQILKAGDFKSAVETFTRTDMSAEDREQARELIETLWSWYTREIAPARGMDAGELRENVEELGIFEEEEAVEAGFFDRLGYFDRALEACEALGGYDPEIDSFTQVAMADYAAHVRPQVRPRPPKDETEGPGTIAVAYAEGTLVYGDSFEPGEIGGDTLARELRDLRKDPAVRAVVLRVNSPGGSALAAETIAREVRLLREAGKPVIVSMGGLAASGGYWISAPSDYIFAEPATITGSIGAFAVIFHFEEAAGKLGITFDRVKTAPLADILSPVRARTPEEMDILQGYLEQVYDDFVQLVAEGRGLDVAEVEAIASGRVWSGINAVELGLADELGGLEKAIAFAAGEVGLADYRLRQVPEERSMQEVFADLFNTGVELPEPPARGLLEENLHRLRTELAALGRFNDPRGAYALLPYRLELR